MAFVELLRGNAALDAPRVQPEARHADVEPGLRDAVVGARLISTA